MLHPDRPLAHPEDDVLGYAPFAENLAHSLLSMAPLEGFVVGIHGPWGSGKSTLLNFLEHFLVQSEAEQQPIWVRFNPWWFSGTEELLTRFFRQLTATLSSNREKVLHSTAEKLAEFGDILSGCPLPPRYRIFGALLARICRRSPKDVHKLKDNIRGELEKSRRKVFVLMDDVDRLTGEEIRELFTLIRAVADFPNVVYLVAFEKDPVIKALASLDRDDGARFLDKVIQLPVELPQAEATQLSDMLTGGLMRALTEEPGEDLLDVSRLRILLVDGLSKLIATPRDVARLLNAFTVSHAPVEGEVNIVDLLGIEAVRLFLPGIYGRIRANHEMFTGQLTVYDHADSQMSLKSFHQAWLESDELGRNDAVRAILELLFPKVKGALDNSRSHGDRSGDWHRHRRICHPDIFDLYLRLSIPIQTPSRADMLALVSLAGDIEAFVQKLQELAHRRETTASWISACIRHLPHYMEGCPAEHVANAVKAVLKASGELMTVEHAEQRSSYLPLYAEIGLTIEELLSEIPESDRKATLLEGIVSAEGLAVPAYLVYSGTTEQASREQQIIDRDGLVEAQAAMLGRFRDAADDGALLREQELAFLLHVWAALGAEQEARDWVGAQVQSREGLVTVVEAFARLDWVARPGEALKRLRQFADPQELLSRLNSMGGEMSWTEKEREALTPFVQAMRDQLNSAGQGHRHGESKDQP